MLPSAAVSAILAFLAVGQASAMEEQITVEDIIIHRVKSPAGESIPKLSFTLNGANAKGQACEAEDIPWPEPEQSFPCGSTDYSFLLLPGQEGDKEFGLMIYHDVRDRKADLRGWVDVDPECKKAESGEETCTLKGPIHKTIDGPVRGFFGRLFGDL